MPAPDFDLIVVGAGPAGASAAAVAAGRGLRVALIDKAAFPREKLCGGGVTGRAMGHLSRVFGAPDTALFHRCTEVRLMAGARLLGAEQAGPPVHMTMRRVFDAALSQKAVDLGAEDLRGQRIADMDLNGTVPQLRLASGRMLTASLLIGADGVNSSVARALYGRAHDPGQVAFALEVEIAGPTSAHLDLDMAALPHGYGWDFPKTGGRTLGVGGRAAINPDMTGVFARWLAARGIDPKQHRVKGHHLPMGPARRVPGRGAVLLVGDAAGLVDPITGEGIGWAIHSGEIAAISVCEALSTGQPAKALPRYRKLAKPMLRELARARLLSTLVYHPMLQPRLHDLLARSPRLRTRFLQLLGGEIDYADLGPARIARLALRVMFRRGGATAG